MSSLQFDPETHWICHRCSRQFTIDHPSFEIGPDQWACAACTDGPKRATPKIGNTDSPWRCQYCDHLFRSDHPHYEDRFGKWACADCTHRNNSRPADPVMYRCDDCGFEAPGDDLPAAQHLEERMIPGDTYTDVECPECGALCFPLDVSITGNFNNVIDGAINAFFHHLALAYPEIKSGDVAPERMIAFRGAAVEITRHYLNANSAADSPHTTDEECQRYIEPDTSVCAMCWVYHGADPCKCGGRGFHNPGCPESDAEE